MAQMKITLSQEDLVDAVRFYVEKQFGMEVDGSTNFEVTEDLRGPKGDFCGYKIAVNVPVRKPKSRKKPEPTAPAPTSGPVMV